MNQRQVFSLNNALTTQEFWEGQYKNIRLHKIKNKHPVCRLVRRFIHGGDGNCIEIGCFPGFYLPMFGELGYTVNGIDIVPQVDILPQWLASNGYRVGRFYREDFLNFNPGKKFTIVCSFGFIEHFNNWEEILKRHIDLVSDNGYIVITAPNFRGFFQNKFHKILDTDNYYKHNIDSMDPESWARILKENGYRVLYSGYFGGLKLWIENGQNSKLRELLRISLMPVNYLGAFVPDSKSFSAMCGIIAKHEGRH
jgi:Methyltransferase domain.